MLTLHPQSAMEHLHHRFVAADGSGSDGAIAFEATEVVVDQPRPDARPGPAGRAARRRAGPLADPARRQRPGGRGRRSRAAAGSAKVAAGGAVERAVDPAPGPDAAAQAGLSAGHAAGRRDARRSVGRPLAILALVVVVGGLGPRRLRLRRQHAAAGDQLGQCRPEGARPGARPTWPRSSAPGDRPRRGRPEPGARRS